jgi:hypothetical protein
MVFVVLLCWPVFLQKMTFRGARNTSSNLSHELSDIILIIICACSGCHWPTRGESACPPVLLYVKRRIFIEIQKSQAHLFLLCFADDRRPTMAQQSTLGSVLVILLLLQVLQVLASTSAFFAQATTNPRRSAGTFTSMSSSSSSSSSSAVDADVQAFHACAASAVDLSGAHVANNILTSKYSTVQHNYSSSKHACMHASIHPRGSHHINHERTCHRCLNNRI